VVSLTLIQRNARSQTLPRRREIKQRGAAGPDPLMQKPGGDHREVGERPSRQAILNPSGNRIVRRGCGGGVWWCDTIGWRPAGSAARRIAVTAVILCRAPPSQAVQR
jgi:hypothetical protein